MGNMTGMPIIEVITIPLTFSTAATPRTVASTPIASPSTPATTPPPVVTSGGQTTQTTPFIPPPPTGPVTVAQPMPSYPYICTVSEPVRKNQGYLPTNGMCDFLFYDSLYKNSRSSLLNGINSMESNPQYVVYQAARYSKTKFGLSFSPE
ncbi:hypothetical protein MTO96_038198 [Rhipicephalus appendiculatus]